MRQTAWRERVVDFFGLKRSVVAVLFIAILVGLGEKMAERFLPIYLLAATVCGLLGTIYFAIRGRDLNP